MEEGECYLLDLSCSSKQPEQEAAEGWRETPSDRGEKQMDSYGVFD